MLYESDVGQSYYKYLTSIPYIIGLSYIIISECYCVGLVALHKWIDSLIICNDYPE